MPDMSSSPQKSIQDYHTQRIHISSSILTCEHPSEFLTTHRRARPDDNAGAADVFLPASQRHGKYLHMATPPWLSTYLGPVMAVRSG